MHTEMQNTKKLKELYQRALAIKSAIPHPRIMGIIRECGGKMNMRERRWADAATDFFEAFKSYDEAGSPRRIQCLKYLVLAHMLSQSNASSFSDRFVTYTQSVYVYMVMFVWIYIIRRYLCASV